MDVVIYRLINILGDVEIAAENLYPSPYRAPYYHYIDPDVLVEERPRRTTL